MLAKDVEDFSYALLVAKQVRHSQMWVGCSSCSQVTLGP